MPLTIQFTVIYGLTEHNNNNNTNNNNNNNNNCLANRPRKYRKDAARQGRTESIFRRRWQPLHGPCMTLEDSQQPARISCVSVFAEGGKPEYPKKNPRSRVENQHKLSPRMTPGPGIEPGPHWWEASALTTAPSLLPLHTS